MQRNSDRPPCFVLRITLRNSHETCTTASGISQTVNKCQGFCSVRAVATADVSEHPSSRIKRVRVRTSLTVERCVNLIHSMFVES